MLYRNSYDIIQEVDIKTNKKMPKGSKKSD